MAAALVDGAIWTCGRGKTRAGQAAADAAGTGGVCEILNVPTCSPERGSRDYLLSLSRD